MPDGGAAATTARFIERLCRPEAYPHPAPDVRLLETHISWVFLAGDYAYKVKKPVNLGFVDFSSLDWRRHYCEEELRLNRRTAPELYLGLVPITGTAAAPVFGGEGRALEYAVKMRRFPQQALLDRIARRGELTAGQVEAFAQAVAGLHAAAGRAGPDGPFGSPPEILAEAVDNFAQLEQVDRDEATPAARQALASWTLREFNRLEPLFARRKHDGFVRECHGDLHLGNVALLDGRPVPFDAIEFNEAFRWVDVMNEVAFPVMDLRHHGLPRLANRFVSAYLDATGDFAGLALLRFYLVYRAMVRAKVSCIRAHQEGIDAGERERAASAYRGHLELAWAMSAPPRAALIVMHGLSGSGKTTISRHLVEAYGAIRVRSDLERKRLHGEAPLARTGAAPGAGLYTAEADRLTYGHLAGLATEILVAGHPVVVDATFLHRPWREMFRELAHQQRVPFVLAACAAPDEVLRARVAARERSGTDASEAGLAVLDRQIASLDPLEADELDSAVIIDSAEIGDDAAAIEKAVGRRIGLAP